MVQAGSRITSLWSRRRELGKRWPLFAVLLAQVLLSLTIVGRPVFLDEATYIVVGRAMIAHWAHGTRTLHYSQMLGGAPVIYPPITATASAIGGLLLTRLLSLCFMLAATAFLYSTARRLFDGLAPIIATGLFVTVTATQFMGALATYDALALLLLSAAAWCAVRAADAAGRARLLLLGGLCVLLLAANAVKYGSALWDPVVLAMAALADARRRDWRKGLLTGAACVTGTVVLLVIALWVGGQPYRQAIFTSTVQHTSNSGTPPLSILWSAVTWVGLLAALAVAGAVMLTRSRPAEDLPLKALGWVLAAAVFLAPLAQARIGVLTSLNKHVGFGAWFAAIPAGYVAAAALSVAAAAWPAISARRWGRSVWAVVSGGAVTLAVLAAAVVGIFQTQHVKKERAAYPASTMARLRPILHASPGHWLADTPNVIIYYTHTFPPRWRTTYNLTYVDPASGRRLTGVAAYAEAIRVHYFSVVVLRVNRLNSRVDQALVAALRGDPEYHESILQATTRPGGKPHPAQAILVWQYRPAGSA